MRDGEAVVSRRRPQSGCTKAVTGVGPKDTAVLYDRSEYSKLSLPGAAATNVINQTESSDSADGIKEVHPQRSGAFWETAGTSVRAASHKQAGADFYLQKRRERTLSRPRLRTT